MSRLDELVIHSLDQGDDSSDQDDIAAYRQRLMQIGDTPGSRPVTEGSNKSRMQGLMIAVLLVPSCHYLPLSVQAG
jgi:hypothetical protein